MDFRSLELPLNISGVTYGVVCLAVAIIVIGKLCQGPKLDKFPTVGSSDWLGSWWAGFKYLTDAQNVIQEGYTKYGSAPFKIAEPSHWTIIMSNRECLEELGKASDNEFSLLEALNDRMQFEHTLGREVCHDSRHIAVIRSHLTRDIEVLYLEIRDEIVISFTEVLDLRGNEWKSVPALSTIEKIVCRTSNRAFVGLPLCHNPDWIDLNLRYAVDVITAGVMIGLLPKFMRSQVTRFFTKVPRSIARGVKLLGPIIEERQKYLNEYGTEWDDKPNDVLSWLMEETEGPELTTEFLTTRVLAINFAAIHTSSNSFTQALFYLAANPQYIQPLREEVECIVEKDGWSKVALGKMRKVDSFLRECQRIGGINIVTLSRKALKDFTFSDGTFIPKETYIAAATRSLHHDENFYRNPEVFEPFRFAPMREEAGKGQRHQFSSTTTEYLAFGYGRHACPGRFFAATELKSMLAHIVVTYDVKLEDNATCPPNWHISTFIAANPRAKVVFRNRVD